MPSPLLFDRGTTDGTTDDENPCHADYDDYDAWDVREVDALSRDALGANASISYADARAGGPPARPLEFPAPVVDAALTVSADVIDHRTGELFRATSVLMRRPVHARTCSTIAPPPTTSSHHGASFDSGQRVQHRRRLSGESAQSWNSLVPDSPRKHSRHHHRHGLNSSSKAHFACGPDCDAPDEAYCVRRKICDTTYGSVRLCVVLRRVSRNVAAYARALGSGECVPTWQTTDEMVAVKVTNWSKLQSLRGRHLEDPIKELAALQQLLGNYHPHVVSVRAAMQSETHLFCVLPYVSGGDLYGSLVDAMASSPTGRIDESLARRWFRQLLCAANHLQKKGVCHRDLCMENMMVDERGDIRIIDFGLCLRVPFADPRSRNIVSDASSNTSRRLMRTQGQCGYWEYMAPEICARSEQFDGFAIDLWALGVVLFEFLVGKKPWSMPDPVDANFHAIAVDGGLAELLRMKEISVNGQAVDLLQNMMWHDPARRLTLAEVVNHPWVRGAGSRVAPAEEDGNRVSGKWFMKSTSIDELDVESTTLLLADMMEPYSGCCSPPPSMASTAQTSRSDSPQHDSLVSPTETEATEAETSEAEAAEVGLDEMNANTQKKSRRWFKFSVKHTKWRGSEKAKPVTLHASDCELT